MVQKILHVDMDAFYAQVEQRDFPQYRNKPLVVGSSGKRGVIAAASYEARKFGVHSAMPSSIAMQKCQHLIFTPPRFSVYHNISESINAIFQRYTDKIERLSLDEAYLDVTQNLKHERSATILGVEIQRVIKQELNLTASVGISYNKFLAKIASDINKPFGITVITPEEANDFLMKLSIDKFYGIGKKTTQKMHTLGITNGEQLKARSREELKHYFGNLGDQYYYIVRGIDNREVISNAPNKSVATENTFTADLNSQEEIQYAIQEIIQKLVERLKNSQFQGRTLSIKVRNHKFITYTRSKTFSSIIPHDPIFIEQIFWELFKQLPKSPIRLIGITLFSPDITAGKQLHLDLSY